MEMILDKKQILEIFLFKFKMGHKAVETTCNINSAFGPGTSNEHIVQWWFKKCCKGDKSLDEGCSGQSLEVDTDQLRASSKLILLQLHKKFPKNSTLIILQLFGIWSKLESWKSSLSGCLMRWPQIRKIVILKGHLLLFYTTTMNHFLIRLWGVMKSGFHTISSVVGQRKSSKALPKAKLATRKGHGHCLVVCFQSDPLQLSKSQQNHYIWEVCLANWRAE